MAECIRPIKLKESNKVVPCGGCNFCLQRRRSDWSVRLYQEAKRSMNVMFITLTYNEEHITYGGDNNGTVVKEELMDLQKNLKQWQTRNLKKHYDKEVWPDWKVKYYSVAEYGSIGGRPHYHMIAFNLLPETIERFIDEKKPLWKKGNVQVEAARGGAINYVTKYLIDRPEEEKENARTFSLMSKGLGEGYIKENMQWHIVGELKGYILHNGRRVALPRYYRDRIFTEEQREYLTVKGQEEGVEEWARELDRLYDFGFKDPMRYIEERRKHLHDSVRVKSIKLNTL